MKHLVPGALSLIAVLLMLALTQAAQAQSHAHPRHAPNEKHTLAHQGSDQATAEGYDEETVQPRIVDGVQVLDVSVTAAGYRPRKIALQAGLPTRLVFTRTANGSCVERVQIPDFGIEATHLPLNQPITFEFTPEHEGEYVFACGMDMMRGMLLVRS
jgi:plastocyanin